MKNLTHNLLAKIVAIFLFAISELAGALSLLAISYLYDEQVYLDRVISGNSLMDFLYDMRYGFIVIACICALLFLASLIFLLCSAGHRFGKNEILPNHQDKIPFDLYIICTGLLLALCLNITFNIGYGDMLFSVVLGISCLVCSTLIALAFLMTLATRLKLGKWWRNTIIYRLVMLLVRLIRKIPLLWKTLLVCAAAGILNIIFTVVSMVDGAGGLVLVLLLEGVLIAGACLAALQMQKLKAAGKALAEGDFDYTADTAKMYWEFKKHGENLNRIGDGMTIAVERQMKSERLKTELITNVSHDLKTPLTSIINYIDLLSREGVQGKSAEYVEVLHHQAQRLKKLTEDLVEASKASTGNIAAELVRTNICELIDQSVAEYAERLKDAKLEAVVSFPENGCHAVADGRLLWRMLDNLLSNACKYSQPDTRVYLNAFEHGGRTMISVKSISRRQLNVNADELMERFVRGDASRSTEGSGLGLNIARSLAQLQGGSLSLTIDGDLFKAEISLPAA